MMFDFDVADKDEAHEYVLRVKGQNTMFWKFVADPKEPVRVTLDFNDAKKFVRKSDAISFLEDNSLDRKGFVVKEVEPT